MIKPPLTSHTPIASDPIQDILPILLARPIYDPTLEGLRVDFPETIKWYNWGWVGAKYGRLGETDNRDWGFIFWGFERFDIDYYLFEGYRGSWLKEWIGEEVEEVVVPLPMGRRAKVLSYWNEEKERWIGIWNRKIRR